MKGRLDKLIVKLKNEKHKKRFLYWNSYQDPEVFNNTVLKIKDCGEIAAKYNGKIFGGFVRNVLIPQHYQQDTSGYKDVDFLFQSEDEAKRFVEEANLEFILDSDEYVCGTIVYPFTRKQYLLKEVDEDRNILIDVIISGVISVDDFNVNRLTYSFVDGFSDESLMKFILNKCMIILPNYIEKLKLCHDDPNDVQWFVQEKRLSKLFLSGWKIFDYISDDMMTNITMFLSLDDIPSDIRIYIVFKLVTQLECWYL